MIVTELFSGLTIGQFLKKHGFNFLSEICPRDIRNMVAHSDFVIQEDGTIQSITKRKSFYSLKQLTDALLEMDRMIKTITDVWVCI